jgi:dihydroorotase (EC 3.5.2.3)
MEHTLISPLDMHIHFREGAMLQTVAPLSAHDFAGGVIMPNLVPPVDNLERCCTTGLRLTRR